LIQKFLIEFYNMKIKFFKDNKHIFAIDIDISSSRYYSNIGYVGDHIASNYDVLGEYSNQLKNVFKYWYNLAKKTFKNGNDIIFCSSSEKFVLLLRKNVSSDNIYLNFVLVENNNNDINSEFLLKKIIDGNFILIAKKINPDLHLENSDELVYKYTILEIIPTKDNFALLLSFLVYKAFLKFSFKCIYSFYNYLRDLIPDEKRLKKVLELDKNKNYIYENIIKYQDLIYDTILDSLKQYYLSNDIYEIIRGTSDLIYSKISALVEINIFSFYKKYYLNNKYADIPSELEGYLILMDKILNKKSKF